ncbi:signal recognition particle receptor alpha subunit, putative [Plasmodium knowlesi strain H]|uniref:Signal recognition particle receptor alpha subunit, putative n=3 Tax=Plasmodium knowlesi TaxID=5850 RepID=A0A5K1U810_PLAKH|nr:signal recognition particle receptor subunit alpha, putative [Plasmodium knowlesi strain H]OTN64632.1 putative Signal recognition particle receptor alpha subunit [Plasmodium knowlesi]CAA9988876.1 signal recognition particle receptor subunit alpha, putative [Plasmodium knowlesi strain H]SBO24712.1 signal recognition particle receptor alpha subunit, putative [Plasmodium knowlesi strain H]SBO27985.1 signal recognition particle receptor alpha subunit, putative [Plasmodium knowlesi strain H]VVS7|eukprot:XP_002261222.1 signal recognition particle receptor alpha subunit, putative [Plasmodium knowlesi strain H]
MIDVVKIFSKGGLILWSYTFYEIEDATIRTIVKQILIEEKYEDFCKKYNKFHAKWKLLNDVDIVILIVYQGIQNSAYVENLFLKIKKSFVKLLPKSLEYLDLDLPLNFDKQFLKIVEDVEAILSCTGAGADRRGSVDGRRGSIGRRKNSSDKTKDDHGDVSEDTGASERTDADSYPDNSDGNCEESKGKKKHGAHKMEGEKYSNKRSEEDEKTLDDDEPGVRRKSKTKKKSAREWELSKKITKKDIEKLDYSKNENNSTDVHEMNKYEGEFEDSSDCNVDNSNHLLNKLNDSILKVFSYNSKIEENDIESILQGVKNKLLSKNVAAGICDTLIEKMKGNLIGKKKTLFSMNVKKTVSTVLSDTIQSILIPKESVDILRAALEAKSIGKLYSIVFLGVNGVGKSTNLAKVCYYLKTKGNLKIMIAACDTFRAGAVEQLRTHANCLDVFLYEKGYGKDAAAIAKEAIAYAKKENFNVILIDTAGRMQDNEPLMRSLGKLILINNPDFILFVGEALVGNDAIDQLKKFNQALTDATCNSNKRTIDGILLTKFDTVDDKVGTALSMVYLTGKPIVFVGIGQKYTHLKKFNVSMVVKALS